MHGLPNKYSQIFPGVCWFCQTPRPLTRPQNAKTSGAHIIKNKEERYSRVPRLSDTRYSAK